MKVLMLGPDMQARGGIAAVVNQYIEAGLGNKVKLKYISTVSDTAQFRKIFSAVFALARFVFLCPHSDIVHVHMASRNSYRRKSFFIRIAKIFKKRVIIHLHGGEFAEFYLNECTEGKQEKIKAVFSGADNVIVLSEEWRNRLVSLLGFGINHKIIVLGNAVKIPEYHRTGYKDNNLIFLGRLVKGKGIDDILQVIPEAGGEFPGLKLLVCGEGDIQKYKGECLKHGISEKVSFLGWISGEKKEEILKGCSVFILPSYNEGLPISMLEAMSYGMAVIVSKVGGIPSVVKDGYNGIVIPPGDTRALCDAIKRMLSDKKFKERIGKNACITIREQFSIEKNMCRLIEIYNSLHRAT